MSFAQLICTSETEYLLVLKLAQTSNYPIAVGPKIEILAILLIYYIGQDCFDAF